MCLLLINFIYWSIEKKKKLIEKKYKEENVEYLVKKKSNIDRNCFNFFVYKLNTPQISLKW